VSPVPDADSDWERALLGHAERGRNVLLYGPIARAGERVTALLGLEPGTPLSGEFEVETDLAGDMLHGKPYGSRLMHHGLLSAGGICACEAQGRSGDNETLVRLQQAGQERVGAAICRGIGDGGALAWARGTVSCDPEQMRGHLLVPLNAEEWFPAESFMRGAVGALGTELLVEKQDAEQRDPMLCIARHANGFFFSGYNLDNTVQQHLRFPQGAPLMLGMHTRLSNGRATYTMPPAWHRECRVFVEQTVDGLLSCREEHSGMIGISRRMRVQGLRDATVRFHHEPGTEAQVTMLRNPAYPYLQGEFLPLTEHRDSMGNYVQADNVSGTVLISW